MGTDDGGSSIYFILALGVLLLMSAFFSASETAFTSMSRIRMKSMESGGDKRAARALQLSENFDRLLSTILVGNNIVNILSTSLATVLFVNWFGNLGVTLSTVVMTVTVIIFGEVSPKSIAKQSPEKFAMFSAPVLRVIMWVLTPIVFLLVKITELVSRIFSSNGAKAAISEDEIITFVETAEQEGGIDEQESELIRSAVEFGDTTAGEIATPRVDVVAVEYGSDADAITAVFLESGFSRLPVYNESLDNVVGVINQKDFFRFVHTKQGTIDDLLKKPTFVTEYMKLQDLMELLQSTKEHIVFVTDEYGGVTGIVTFEDVLEELVGEIWDEHDDVVEDIVEIDPTSWRINASIGFDKLTDRFGFEDERDDDEFSSVSGWVMDELEKIPEVDDEFEYRGYLVRVDKTDDRRVLEIIMTALPSEEEEQ